MANILLRRYGVLLWVLFGAVTCQAQGPFVLENASLGRTLSTDGGVLRTIRFENKLNGTTSRPTSDPEFRLRISQGTDKPQTTYTLTAADFRVISASRLKDALVFGLENARRRIRVQVRYELSPGDFYMRKRLLITSAQPVTLERIDVEALGLADAYQPYTTRQITARGPWSPGLGQPLYTSTSGTFWGVEFPAADNRVRKGVLLAGYLRGRRIEANQPYASYPAVMGVADDARFVSDAFYQYIDRIRIRPLRLEVQYNSWFDTGGGVSKESFARSVATINHQLVELRGNPPLKMYVIDDGWQDAGADWSEQFWKVNGKFDPDFAFTRQAVTAVHSGLGLWLSPGCVFGARGEVPRLRARGFEAMDDWMSMAGPRYMQALQDRLLALMQQGVGFFKLDGLFGHLNAREFELHGDKYGIPYMPQLGLKGFTSSDARLNDAKYDELKIYYLTAGTERLMRMFDKMAAVNPNVYIVISNGAYLSPWWLMHVDTVWMINAGDAAEGGTRTSELVYRDGIYYQIWRQQHTQFPMCGIFNHEPKKTTTGEPQDVFRKYLYMHLSRGTGFIELYIRPAVLQAGDWDVISEGLRWASDVFPTFKRVRMHGGDPRAGEVYGYTAWTRTQGYVSLHNPSGEPRTYSVKLDRAFGLLPGSGPFYISSPLDGSARDLPAVCTYGDSLTFQLKPREVRIVDFDNKLKDWRFIKALQVRDPDRSPAAFRFPKP